MRRSIPSSELITKVYQLAHAILGDEESAFEVTKKAAQGWEVEFQAQRDRTRYQLDPYDFRQKLIMNDDLALQFLTLKLCERVEKAQELAGLNNRGPLPHESYFVIRYIKYLIYKTVHYRSFHVAVGVCRLVYDFSKRETTQIYEALVQDPRLRKDDQMYKDWKLGLIRALYEKRFPGLLNLEEGPQGVKQFRRRDGQDHLTEVALQALRLFSPWGTSCRLPERLTRRYSFDEFKFGSRNPDAESQVEERRMYAVINPECFSRLLMLLGVGVQGERLALPLFNLPNNKDTIPPVDFTRPPELSSVKWMELVDYLNTGRRRRREKASALSIEIEGVERATLDLEERQDVSLRLEEDEDLVQVFLKQEGGNVLLGSLLLSSAGVAGDGHPWSGQVKLGWGRHLGITINPSAQHPYTTTGANLNLRYEEGGRVQFLLRRARLAASSHPTKPRPVVAHAASGPRYPSSLTPLFVIFCAVVILLLLWLGYRGAQGPQSVDLQAPRAMPSSASPEAQPPQTSAIPIDETKPGDTQAKDVEGDEKRPDLVPGKGGLSASTSSINKGGKASTRVKAAPRHKESARQPTTTSQPHKPRTGKADDDTVDERMAGVEAPDSGNVTRGGGSSSGPGLSLKEVKIIYVEPLQERGAGGDFQQALVKGLELEAGMAVNTFASGRDSVDAVLRWSVRRRQSRWTVFANLVNRRGTELWSETLTIYDSDESRLRTEATRRLLDSLKAKQARGN